MFLRTQKHLRCRRVISFLHQQPEDFFALFGQPNSAGGKALYKFRWQLHVESKLPWTITISRIILKKIGEELSVAGSSV